MSCQGLGKLWKALVLAATLAGEIEAGQAIVFEVDGAKRQPISPYIYGTNQPDWQGHPRHFTLCR